MNRRLTLTLAATVLAMGACSDVPTSNTEAPQLPSFVLFGQPDGNDHPYVGFSLFYDPSVPGWFRCSGTLLNATTFLTAGHCAFGVSSNGHDTWVTFDEHVDLSAFRDATTLAGEIAALEADDAFTRGTSTPNPAFGQSFPNTSDIGVVKLDGPVSLSEYGQLADEDALNDLAKHEVFDIVGYGLQDVKPIPLANLDRVQGQAKLVNATSGFSGGFNLHLSSNNGGPHRGGLCFGDSGGPVLEGDVVYGVNSFVINTNCAGSGYSYRVDLKAVRDWIISKM